MTRRASWLAAGAYLLVALVFTWPLATVIGSEIAWDMGDSLFNSWVLLWTGGQVLAFLSGDFSALNRFWHGNIFFPERLTVAFSEHLVPQMVQALPILAATDNVVLAYNLLFLSTFVLSGLGMFLLVRELTGSPVAGFVAGLAFAFAPYRVAQFSHLQVLSAQWMPFVIYGFRRYFETRERRPLIGGTVALVVQNLSCGYYLLFFAPFVGAYVVYEMTVRGLVRDWRLWRTWITAGVVALVLTFPFMRPYLEVRQHSGVGVRSQTEIAAFSADVHAFVTPAEPLRLWSGRLPAFDKPEGQGFPGLTIVLLAFFGSLAGFVRTRSAHPGPRSVVGYFVISAVVAATLALGPQITMGGTVLGTGPYAWLVAYVPGFDGVRVPARFLMVVALFLAGLAGYGTATLCRWRPRLAPVALVVAGLLILGESWPGAFKTNTRLWAEGVELPPRVLHVGDDIPPIYKHLRDEPGPVVLIELPFGAVPWDLHAQFYAGYHRRSLVNGFSGFFPDRQRTQAEVFMMVRHDPEAAWRGLVASRATHALVHEHAFVSTRRELYTAWLEQRGAVKIMSDGDSHLYRIR